MPGQLLLQLSCYLSTVSSDVFVGHACQIESLRMLLRSGAGLGWVCLEPTTSRGLLLLLIIHLIQIE